MSDQVITPTADITTTPAVTTEPVTTTPATVTATTTPATTTEPAKEPVTPTEPAKTEVEPPKTEPVKTEPAKVEPPKYELKASEGSLLTKEQVAEIETIAKSSNLTEEQAKKVLATQEQSLKAFNDRLMEQHKVQVNKWEQDMRADKVLGGDNFGRTLELNKKATDFFADETFRAELESSGFGNHPGLVRMLAKIGEAMGTNGAFIKPNTTEQPQQKRAADILYGNKS